MNTKPVGVKTIPLQLKENKQSMKSRTSLKILFVLPVAMTLTAKPFAAMGQTLTFEAPTYTPGPLSGQDQWQGVNVSDDLKIPPGTPVAVVPRPIEHLKVRLSWGHRSAAAQPFRIGFLTNGVGVAQIAPDGFEAGDTLQGGVCETRAGAGDVDAVTADVSWPKPAKPPRKPHSIWQHLLDHGEPGQVARLKDDPGLQPDAPVLTVLTAADGTRGFSIGLEQLARHKAMWLPEHDVFVTLADAPVDFAAHLASLKGERVLDRVKHEPEATLAEWTDKWADFGNPTQPHHGSETELLGTKGHLTGFVARHGSIYKFGVDRWGRVRPDLAFAAQVPLRPALARAGSGRASGSWMGCPSS